MYSLWMILISPDKAKLGLSEQVALVAGTDQVAPCQVDFGAPMRASLHVSDGHPILWIWLHEAVAGDWPDHLNTVACGTRVIETTLQWEVVLPGSLGG